jgi:hypothetical protein
MFRVASYELRVASERKGDAAPSLVVSAAVQLAETTLQLGRWISGMPRRRRRHRVMCGATVRGSLLDSSDTSHRRGCRGAGAARATSECDLAGGRIAGFLEVQVLGRQRHRLPVEAAFEEQGTAGVGRALEAASEFLFETLDF